MRELVALSNDPIRFPTRCRPAHAMLGYFKFLLTLIGARLSDHVLLQLQAFVNYVGIGRWMHNHGFFFSERVSSREEVWARMISKVRDQKVLYMEFGVAVGGSMQYWVRELKNPTAVFHGFDSFEGLPERGGPWYKGQFDALGRLPIIDDSRVSFFKGWFDQVLPHYHLPAHDVLVINMDADLYSSTIYVLNYLRSQIKAGTLIYFDEMNHLDHELRAFEEFTSQNSIKFRPICADTTLAHVSFECTKVEKVNPDLVVRDKEGKPCSVRYDAVNAMLLNEFLKEHRTVQQQQKEIDALKAELKEQRAFIQKVSDKVELNKSALQLVLHDQ
jgi:hypothetical protein